MTEVYQPAADFNGDLTINPGAVDAANYGFPAPNGLSPPQQPGSSKAANGTDGKEKVVMNYTTDFPKLPEVKGNTAPAGAWGRRTLTMAVVTETYVLSAAERASMNLGSKGFGLVEQQKCSQVAGETNTKIELSEASDKSLTILITGKKSDVENAHARLVRELQTSTQVEVKVAHEFYGAIIGKEGARRKQLENEFLCRIFLPGRDEQSDIVRVVGPLESAKACAKKLSLIVAELEKQASETLEIPREYYAWIRGPANSTLEKIQNETGVKVNIPVARSKNETVIIAGEREGVYKAVALVKKIVDGCKKNKSITCKVNRGQHRYIIGQQRSGIDEILKATNVLVEVPAEEEDSDTITLRGPQEKLSEALSLVFARATSIIALEIKYPEWQRRFLIGPKGATLQQLVPKQDRLSIDFEEGQIYLEGPPEVVKAAHAALGAEIARLSKENASETIKVPAYLHRHIIGRSGALVNKIKEDHSVQITIPDEKKGSDEIRVEGKKEGVKNAVKVLKERAAELEKKMPADKQPPVLPPEEVFKTSVDVDPKWHRHFVSRGAEVIREIQEKYGGVVISFPRQESNDSKVQIKGPKASIDQAKKKIEDIVADLEAQVTESLDIAEEHHRSLVVHANDLRQKYNVRLRFPPKGTSNENAEAVNGILPGNFVQISGRQENVEKAKAALNELIPVTNTLIIPAEYHSTLIGKKGESIRAVMQQHNVRVNIPPADKQSEEVVIIGPPKNVEAATADLLAKVNELGKTAEDKRLRGFKVALDIPAEYHQRLIGSGGGAVKEFMKKYDVHLAFPRDQTETVTISGYEDKANEAKTALEQLVEDYKNMVSLSVQLDPRFLYRFTGPRNKTGGVKKLQEDYKVEITIPGRNDPDPSLVFVSGKIEDNVYDCIDKLRMIEEDFMQDVVERSQYQYRRHEDAPVAPPPTQVEITGAPWQLDNMDQFPSMGQETVNAQPTGVWGRRR